MSGARGPLQRLDPKVRGFPSGYPIWAILLTSDMLKEFRTTNSNDSDDATIHSDNNNIPIKIAMKKVTGMTRTTIPLIDIC